MKNTKITTKLARKVKDVVSKGLTCDIGVPKPGKMCVEASVCYAMGEPHGDNPSCVKPLVRSIKIVINDDGNWRSTKDRANGMIKLAIAQLGSKSLSDKKYARSLLFATANGLMPAVFKEKGIKHNKVGKAIRVRDLDSIMKVYGENCDPMFNNGGYIYGAWTLFKSRKYLSCITSCNHEIEELIYESDRKTTLLACKIVLEALKHSPGYKFLYLLDK